MHFEDTTPEKEQAINFQEVIRQIEFRSIMMEELGITDWGSTLPSSAELFFKLLFHTLIVLTGREKNSLSQTGISPSPCTVATVCPMGTTPDSSYVG